MSVPREALAKIRNAARVLLEVADTLNDNGSVCGHCHVMARENMGEYTTARSLRSAASKIMKAANFLEHGRSTLTPAAESFLHEEVCQGRKGGQCTCGAAERLAHALRFRAEETE